MDELKLQIDPDYVPENHFEVEAIVSVRAATLSCTSLFLILFINIYNLIIFFFLD